MQIYLIRHAHALAGDDDAVRPLSKKGHKQIRQIGSHLRKRELLETHEFWHSPLVRAEDTAKRLVEAMKLRAKLSEVKGLLHDDDPALMARRLNGLKRAVAVVGHEPHLSALASLLLAGRPQPPLVVLRKCAVLALERANGGWAVRWQISPEVLD